MAAEEDISCTTVEYTHSPQRGVPGFWGTFAITENWSFDPKNPKSGINFVRHNGFVRENMICFNFILWVDKSEKPAALRVHSESLKALSHVRPDEFPWPGVIPTTHTAPQQTAANGVVAPPRIARRSTCP